MSSSSSSEVNYCEDGKRRILLQPFFQRHFIPNVTDGYRIRIVVAAACQMPAEIFRYIRHPPDIQDVVYDEFTGVCSAADLEEFPVDEPRVTDDPPVYRADEVDLVFESQHRALEAWDLIQREVALLKATLDAADELQTGDALWIGEAP